MIGRLDAAADVARSTVFAVTEAPPAVPKRRCSPAIDHLARRLFANPRETTPASDARRDRSRSRRRDREGKSTCWPAESSGCCWTASLPREIVVAVRDLDGYGGLIDEFFSAAGIPFACEAGTPLSRLAPFKALANLLALELEDWPFRRLMGLLDCGLFRPAWEETAQGEAMRDVAAELRRWELEGGRERILVGTRTSGRRRDSRDGARRGRQRFTGTGGGEARLPLLGKLSEATGALRRSHDLEGWAAVMATLVRDFGFDRAPLDGDSARSPRMFGEMLAAILFDVARAEQLTGAEPAPLSLAEFVGELTDLLERQRLRADAAAKRAGFASSVPSRSAISTFRISFWPASPRRVSRSIAATIACTGKESGRS